VQPLAVVEDFDVVRDGEAGPGAGGEPVVVKHLVLQAEKKLSATALSQQTPVRPTLVWTRIRWQYW